MSKRAEELASVLCRMAMLETSHDLRVKIGMDELLSKASALIDAELLKERERCSERLLRAFGNLKPSERSSWIDIEATIKLACSKYPEKQDSSE